MKSSSGGAEEIIGEGALSPVNSNSKASGIGDLFDGGKGSITSGTTQENAKKKELIGADGTLGDYSDAEQIDARSAAPLEGDRRVQ